MNTKQRYGKLRPGARMARLVRLAVILAAVFVVFGSFLLSGGAQAQTAGVDRALVVKQLLEKHAEKPVGMGIAANGGIIELFTSPDGATWTLIMTMPNGKSVMLGSGEDWAGAPVLPDGQKI
jgi:hypothetical protein